MGMKGCPGALLSHPCVPGESDHMDVTVSHSCKVISLPCQVFIYLTVKALPWKECENSEVLQGALILGNFRQALRQKNPRLQDLDKNKRNNGTLLV